MQKIKDMFQRDIDRNIDGVVKVDDACGVRQELDEYVVTKELQGLFDDFFAAFDAGLDDPTRNTGVWIQGYFGSGKSHFLKMLSYLLENREVDGRPAAEYFDGKFANELTYANILRAARSNNETILFNIDERAAGYKEGDTSETAVLHAIARVFYEHLGFYGEDYKLARFEKMIDDRGKTQEFRQAYKDITGDDWVEARDSYDMFGEEVAEAANRAAGLSVASIRDWADSTDSARIQIGDLVSDINEYAEKRERECGGTFRLVFMIDEMGQYLNGNVGRMLNLQTLMEQFGDKCSGRVWMVVTSQEAIDEMMNVVATDFSKIQGRFSTRLALSSSSVDEVIKQRILAKTDDAAVELGAEYDRESAVLSNLFSFDGGVTDMRGYAGPRDFVESFPFVGYQFKLMPNILKEIRKHGYQGKSLSTGERSMLSCYQEATQAVEDEDGRSLVPLWRFFDTLERELDHGDRQVFERCRRAADAGQGLEPFDVDVLKVLYLINHLNDIKPTAANIAILLIDGIDVDMVALRERTKKALERLVHENYVARNGERYGFLTDEEQDVAREIREVQVEPTSVLEEIQRIVYEGIFKERKFHKGANDFPIERYVDGVLYGASTNGMKLDIVTYAGGDLVDASDAELDLKSTDDWALVVLDGQSDYYDVLYNAARIARYVQTQNVQALSPSKQRIIRDRQQEAATNRKEAVGLISDAITHARVFVAGHSVKVPAANAKQKIEAALDELAERTFTKAGYIDAPINDDAQLRQILDGKVQQGIDGQGEDADAVAEVVKYLDLCTRMHQPTTMEELRRHFQERPYGWREIDIAAVVARLWADQKVALERSGQRLEPSDRKACDWLRKASEAGKVTVSKREAMPARVVKGAKALLRDLGGPRTAPEDEDGLVAAVEGFLTEREAHFKDELARYFGAGSDHPGKDEVERAIHLASEALRQKGDPEAFLRAFADAEDDFLDNAEDLKEVENFFQSEQVNIFDSAAKTSELLRKEKVYVEGDAGVQDALRQMDDILHMARPYGRIKDLRGLEKEASDAYAKLVGVKQREVLSQIEAALDEVERYGKEQGAGASGVAPILAAARQDGISWRDKAHAAKTCTELDALKAQTDAWRKSQLSKIDNVVAAAAAEPRRETPPAAYPADPTTAMPPHAVPAPSALAKPKPKTKVLDRASVLPPVVMHDETEVDTYLATLKARLMDALDGADGVRLG